VRSTIKIGENRMEMEDKNMYQKNAELKLGELDAKIDGLVAKAKGLEANVREGYFKKLEKLQSQKVAAQQKLRELKGESKEAWGDVKTSFEKALKDLDEGFRSAAARFK
jgi:hypothetical protein